MTTVNKGLNTSRGWALISVTDKTGVADFGRGLQTLGFKILSTGGTAVVLRDAGLDVTEVSEHTGSPEMLGGRVKTLHPRLHGGILGDLSRPEHVSDMREHSIDPIALVCVNLYNFAGEARDKGLDAGKAIDYVDIGGPAMLRSAAKNFAHVLPVVDPRDYAEVLSALGAGTVDSLFRQRYAAKVFRAVSTYDAMIGTYLSGLADDTIPATLTVGERELTSKTPLRYGENPQQQAAFFKDPHASWSWHEGLIQGKELSYNNLLDLDAALALAQEFGREIVAVVVIKHTNPCGVALGHDSVANVWRRALSCDPSSAFGGIVAINQTIDAEAASALAELFLECILAPDFSPEAKSVLATKKNLRLIAVPSWSKGELKGTPWQLRSLHNGILVQSWDKAPDATAPKVATAHKPNADDLKTAHFAAQICKHVKSNAIVVAEKDRLLAIGCGQTSRIEAVQHALTKAVTLHGADSLSRAALASDAFFPFRDSIDAAARAGIRIVTQPGGSMRDAEVVTAADELGVAMVLTGTRHFRH